MKSEGPVVMEPPDNFVEQAVERALLALAAEEEERSRPWRGVEDDDLDELTPDELTLGEEDGRFDSGIFEVGDDGPPTIPYIRAEGS